VFYRPACCPCNRVIFHDLVIYRFLFISFCVRTSDTLGGWKRIEWPK
jgi:hypothetical protein